MLSLLTMGWRRLMSAQGGASTAEVFSSVYRHNRWGRNGGQRFFSGPGSHDPDIVEPYVAAVCTFLDGFAMPPQVTDLGCGDFNVGSRIRSRCGAYTACDIVPELIRHNTQRFAALNVDFRCVNIIDDAPPPGEVAFLRQVLQHLSNAQISRVVPKLTGYRHLVLTEHLPDAEEFTPNLDHEAGSGIRVARGSGVVLTAPPFNFAPRAQQELCRVRKYGGWVVTTAYENG
jgi:hypothetical protein